MVINLTHAQYYLCEHLKGDITLIRKDKAKHVHLYRFFEDTRRQIKSLV